MPPGTTSEPDDPNLNSTNGLVTAYRTISLTNLVPLTGIVYCCRVGSEGRPVPVSRSPYRSMIREANARLVRQFLSSSASLYRSRLKSMRYTRSSQSVGGSVLHGSCRRALAMSLLNFQLRPFGGNRTLLDETDVGARSAGTISTPAFGRV